MRRPKLYRNRRLRPKTKPVKVAGRNSYTCRSFSETTFTYASRKTPTETGWSVRPGLDITKWYTDPAFKMLADQHQYVKLISTLMVVDSFDIQSYVLKNDELNYASFKDLAHVDNRMYVGYTTEDPNLTTLPVYNLKMTRIHPKSRFNLHINYKGTKWIDTKDANFVWANQTVGSLAALQMSDLVKLKMGLLLQPPQQHTYDTADTAFTTEIQFRVRIYHRVIFKHVPQSVKHHFMNQVDLNAFKNLSIDEKGTVPMQVQLTDGNQISKLMNEYVMDSE